jgi:preprotein translocase subunit SecE
MKLTLYKPEQGRAVRLACYLGVLVMVLWGCINLYHAFPSGALYETLVGPVDLFGVELRITPMLLISAGIFAALSLALYFFFNWPKMAEFLIETEGELKRVSWPERKEYVGASFAVVVLVIFIVVYLYAVDIGLTYVLTNLRIGF